MNRLAGTLAAVLMALSCAGGDAASADEETGAPLATRMRKARESSGFQLRVSLTSVEQPGEPALRATILIIGVVDAHGQRLLLRGLTPRNFRERHVAVALLPGEVARAIQYTRDGPDARNVDLHAPLYGSGLTLFDLLGVWWQWPHQRLEGTLAFDGHACTQIRSRPEHPQSPVAEVLSCVDPQTRLAWHTQLLDARGGTLRAITVARSSRRTGGRAAARLLHISDAHGGSTTAEVYSGDENYAIPPGTFATLEAALVAGQ